MLLALRDYLKQRPSANLVEMARHLQQPVELVRVLLGHWTDKGRVLRLPPPNGCGTRCQACVPDQAEVYQWITTCSHNPPELT